MSDVCQMWVRCGSDVCQMCLLDSGVDHIVAAGLRNPLGSGSGSGYIRGPMILRARCVSDVCQMCVRCVSDVWQMFVRCGCIRG